MPERMMNIKVRFMTVGLLLCGLPTYGSPSLDEFYGVRIGMSRDEILSVMKGRGFNHFVDLALVGSKVPEEGPYCYGIQLNLPYSLYQLTCSRPEESVDSIFSIDFQLYEGKLFKIKVAFDPMKSAEASSGIVGKFGLPPTNRNYSAEGEKDGSKERCRRETCKAGVWTSRSRLLIVVSARDKLPNGGAVTLSLFDRPILEKIVAKESSNVVDEAKKQATKLKF
jgi:hypothetical protein